MNNEDLEKAIKIKKRLDKYDNDLTKVRTETYVFKFGDCYIDDSGYSELFKTVKYEIVNFLKKEIEILKKELKEL